MQYQLSNPHNSTVRTYGPKKAQLCFPINISVFLDVVHRTECDSSFCYSGSGFPGNVAVC